MKSDLHIHTSFSHDGVSSPGRVVQKALEKGLDCIAITDHNKIQGAKEAMAKAGDHSLLVVPGIEINSESGHILGLNIKKEIPPGLSVKETIKRIKEQGGAVVIPHPFHFLWMRFKELENVSGTVDAIEVFNAQLFRGANQKALEYVYHTGSPFTLGSDAHRAKSVGKAYIKTESFFNFSQLMDKIREREVEADSRNPNAFEKVLKHSQVELDKARNIFAPFCPSLVVEEKGERY